MDIPKKMSQKLDFESPVHQRINQLLSIIDTFKGSWKILEQNKSGYLPKYNQERPSVFSK